MLLRGSTTNPGKNIFIGVAPRSDVATYLATVPHTEIVDVRFDPFRALYRDVAGAKAPSSPTQQTFWAATATGPGEQELKWDLRSGAWAVVVMNADATGPVAVNLQAGARSDLLWPVFIGLLIGGLVMLLIGVPLIVLGAAGLGRATGPGGRATRRYGPVTAGAGSGVPPRLPGPSRPAAPWRTPGSPGCVSGDPGRARAVRVSRRALTATSTRTCPAGCGS